MASDTNGGQGTTSMAYARDERALRGDPVAEDERRGGAVSPRPLHDLGARGDGASVGGGAAPGPRTAVPRGGGEDRSLDDDRDAGRALAAPRRGRVPLGARSPE